MIGAIAGAALGAAGSIAGGIASSKARKKAKQYLEQQQKENQDWYNRRYNEDETQRADAQRLLTMTEEAIKNRNKASAGTQAVMGGTEESVAADKAANAQALADATAKIASNASSRKDSVESQYRQTNQSIENQLAGVEQQRATDVANATTGVLQTAGSIANSIDSANTAKQQLKMEQQNQKNWMDWAEKNGIGGNGLAAMLAATGRA